MITRLPDGSPGLFSDISCPGRTRVIRTTSRQSSFCGKRRAAKLHGLNLFKMPIFQKYGNKTIFSLGVGTVSTAEFPGSCPPGPSPSENRSWETYRPLDNLIRLREIEGDTFPGPGFPAGHPVSRPFLSQIISGVFFRAMFSRIFNQYRDLVSRYKNQTVRFFILPYLR